MARTPITPEQWAHARAMWEGDDKVSFAMVGESLGISKQAVAKKAKESPVWQKRMDREKVAAAAHRAADSRVGPEALPLASLAVSGESGAAQVDAGLSKKGVDSPAVITPAHDPSVDVSTMSPAELAEQRAIAQRTEILARQRTELSGARKRIYESLNANDPLEAFARGKVAKITTEALSILHVAERKAWGIPEREEKPNDGSVVILERG